MCYTETEFIHKVLKLYLLLSVIINGVWRWSHFRV